MTRMTLLTTYVSLLLATTSFAQTASVPWVEDFDGGALGPEWTLYNSNSYGRILLTSSGSVSPLSGANALVMDVNTNGNYATNTATLLADFSATGGGILKYFFKETADENDPEDGVFLSDGVTSVLAQSHQNGPSTWTEYEIDLTAVAAANGFSLTAPLQIVFSHRDNYSVPTDGFFFDDVRLLPPPVPDTGQANGLVSGLVINGGLNLNGQPADPDINGPFFASGSTLDLTVSGEPNRPWLLMLGPLQRNNWVIPGIGSLDVGMLAPLSLADVVFVLDGFGGTSFFDQFAVTVPSGVVSLGFDLGPLPPGLIGTFQVAILETGGLKLTAAFEFTVTP